MKWSATLTLSRRWETSPLFITTPLAPAGPLWPKVFVGPKKPGRWPRGSTDEARSSPGSDSGNATGPGTHWHARFWPDSGNTANQTIIWDMFACNLPFLSLKTRARRRKTLILEGNCLKGYYTSKLEFVIIYSPFDKQRTDDGYSSGPRYYSNLSSKEETRSYMWSKWWQNFQITVSILKRATVYLVYVFTWFVAVTLSVFVSYSVYSTWVCDRVLHRSSHPSPVVSVGPTVCDHRQQGSAAHPCSLSASERSELREGVRIIFTSCW